MSVLRLRLAIPVFGLVAVMSGCGTDQLSCEGMNDRQSDESLQTCISVHSSSEGGTLAIPLDDGRSHEVDRIPSVWSGSTFDDGLVLYVDDSLAHFSDGTAAHETVPVDAWGYGAAAPVGDRYALALEDGSLSIRSRASAEVISMPIEIEFMRIDDLAFAENVPMSFSGDATRLAVVEARRHAFVLDADNGDLVWETMLDADADAVSLSSDGTRVAVVLDDTIVCVWRLSDGGLAACRDHPRRIDHVEFTPDDQQLVVWLVEGKRTRRVNIYRPHSPENPGSDPTKTRDVTTTTPAIVAVWRLP